MPPPLAFCAIAPLDEIPVLPPPDVSLAVTLMFPAALVIVDAFSVTMVVAVVLVPVTLTPVPATMLPD